MKKMKIKFLDIGIKSNDSFLLVICLKLTYSFRKHIKKGINHSEKSVSAKHSFMYLLQKLFKRLIVFIFCYFLLYFFQNTFKCMNIFLQSQLIHCLIAII